MDLLPLFKEICKQFINVLNLSFYVGNFKISVGSIVIFCALVSIVTIIIRGLID